MTEIILDSPITQGERTIERLVFKDPITRHLMAADKHPSESAAFVVAMASAMSGEPEVVLANLSPADWVKVHTYVRQCYGQFFGVARDQIVAMMALELKPDDMRYVLEAYSRINDIKPEQLLSVGGGKNPT